MEITIPHFFSDSDDDSTSSGVPSPVQYPGARVTSTDPLPEWQCKYTGRICPHPRARKTNGKLHRLCQEHRVRANVNQRRLQQKRREARAELRSPYPLSPAKAVEPLDQGWEDWIGQILKEDEPLEQEPLAALATEPLTAPCELTDEDVEALTQLFTSSISTDSTDHEIYDVMYGAIHKSNQL